MSKHSYQTKTFKTLNWERIAEQTRSEPRVIFGVDVAKEVFVGALMKADRSVLVTLKWSHPQQTRELVERLITTVDVERLEVVLEPGGTYGDALRGCWRAAGVAVFRMSPKRTHDARELYDGVPSLHDAKAAYLPGRLHLDGVSQRWREPAPQRRELRAAVAELELHQSSYQRHLNRLEAQLSRHWPEVSGLLELDSVTLLNLLIECGSPEAVANQAEAAGALMRRSGRGRLTEAKVRQVLTSAATTVGLACLEPERRYLSALAREALHSYRGAQQVRHALEQRVEADSQLAPMAALVGRVTSAVLIASPGSPRNFPSAASYVKGLGLNLKEHSSGKHQGQLKITKRGPARARQYLYLAVLRRLQHEPLIAAWYQAKVQRDGGRLKGKALVALMRKLAKAVWHAARGRAFDAEQLLDRQALTGAR